MLWKKKSHMAVLGNMKMALLPAAHHSPEQKQSVAGGEKDVWTSDGVKAIILDTTILKLSSEKPAAG